MTILDNFKKKCLSLAKRDDGMAATEAAMLFPILFTLCFGIYDLGHGIIVKQKVISASHIAGDLITREAAVSTPEIQDAIEAAKLAIDPYDRTSFGVDIASVHFIDEETPEIIWRHTENAEENKNVLIDSLGLGTDGEGVLVVTVHYEYTPFFYKMFFDKIDMTEVSYLRGRKSAVIQHEDLL